MCTGLQNKWHRLLPRSVQGSTFMAAKKPGIPKLRGISNHIGNPKGGAKQAHYMSERTSERGNKSSIAVPKPATHIFYSFFFITNCSLSSI